MWHHQTKRKNENSLILKVHNEANYSLALAEFQIYVLGTTEWYKVQSDPTKYALQTKTNINQEYMAKLKSTTKSCMTITHIKCISNTTAI